MYEDEPFTTIVSVRTPGGNIWKTTRNIVASDETAAMIVAEELGAGDAMENGCTLAKIELWAGWAAFGKPIYSSDKEASEAT